MPPSYTSLTCFIDKSLSAFTNYNYTTCYVVFHVLDCNSVNLPSVLQLSSTPPLQPAFSVAAPPHLSNGCNAIVLRRFLLSQREKTNPVSAKIPLFTCNDLFGVSGPLFGLLISTCTGTDRRIENNSNYFTKMHGSTCDKL